ncbi:nucleotide kinase domain-containing protein [Mycolicibacterium lacusdiani]|uniref:nucleotide kinase domain-containing protein n=1 Tax=Mycolicibacterium lacusdiani TaxID=2895283 RepID=UPI001EF22BE2|nr:nucleotide kinase domain-containing protein [Mycolicibacterium lacusdiani]
MSLEVGPRQLAFTGLDDEPMVAPPRSQITGPVIKVAGRTFETTPVFDTYWAFAARRQHVYEARLAGLPGPWTTDPVLRSHRFTNCFRASDRVSQFLIRNVAYCGSQEPEELVFRVLLFKLFNKIETWQLLEQQLGFPTLSDFDVTRYGEVLDDVFARGQRLYSAAYVMPPPQLGADRKHRNHLRLLDHMMGSKVTDRLTSAPRMQDAFEVLKSYPAIGDFLAFQFLIDINYTRALNFDEMEFVVAGPGARDGIRKCFGPASAGVERELIEYMAHSQDEHFARLGLTFGGLFGRPLQLIDCQNLFCEVDKYARVMHPDIAGYSGRSRIKQKFHPISRAVPAWFPPKWRLGLSAELPGAC